MDLANVQIYHTRFRMTKTSQSNAKRVQCVPLDTSLLQHVAEPYLQIPRLSARSVGLKRILRSMTVVRARNVQDVALEKLLVHAQ